MFCPQQLDCLASSVAPTFVIATMDQTSEAEKIFRLEKFDEILSSLLSAGYHRAAVDSLSEFDKVVGGLCWCITSIGIDVDVDILFQENSTIGQRIALSEAIVTTLRLLNCPHPLQAHQIQGINYLQLNLCCKSFNSLITLPHISLSYSRWSCWV